MTLLNMWGLLGLLGLVVLIIIYILKPKYQEKTLSSTFIWQLSLKYRKPKTPFDWLKSSLILLLQVLVLLTLTMLMMDPNYKLNTLSGEKIVIIDASASMQKTAHQDNYFTIAKKKTIDLALQTTPKDRFSIIYASNQPEFIVRRSSSIDYIKQNLTNLEATNESVDYQKSMQLLESVLRENPNALVYFYTNKTIDMPKNIAVVNLDVNEHNIGILNFQGTLKPNGYYMFESTIINYGKPVSAVLSLFVNGSYKQSKEINIDDNKVMQVAFDTYEVLTYQDAYITIDIEDGYLLDNTYRTYGQFGAPIKVLMYSESDDETKSTLYFLRNALESLSKRLSIDVITDEADLKSGYDLYIYDTYSPAIIPTDGSIWLINPQTITDLSLYSSGELSGDFDVIRHLSSTEAYKQVASLLDPQAIRITKYQQITQYPEFERLLSINNDPILLTKEMNGQKITVFAFDFSYSNLGVLVDYPLFIQGLYNYSNSSIVEKQHYYTGEKVTLSLKPDAYGLVLNKDGEERIIESLPYEMTLTEPGTYVVTQQFNNKPDEHYSFFVSVDEKESYQTIDVGTVTLPYIQVTAQEKNTDLKSLIPYFLIALYGLLLIEWWVQYREQY